MLCNICGLEISDVAYIEVGASIVIRDPELKEPLVFNSPAQRSYYNVKIIMHDRCWISLVGTNTQLDFRGGLGLIPVSS